MEEIDETDKNDSDISEESLIQKNQLTTHKRLKFSQFNNYINTGVIEPIIESIFNGNVDNFQLENFDDYLYHYGNILNQYPIILSPEFIGKIIQFLYPSNSIKCICLNIKIIGHIWNHMYSFHPNAHSNQMIESVIGFLNHECEDVVFQVFDSLTILIQSFSDMPKILFEQYNMTEILIPFFLENKSYFEHYQITLKILKFYNAGLKFCVNELWTYYRHLLPILFKEIRNSFMEVKQESFFLLNQLASYEPALYYMKKLEINSILSKSLSMLDSQSAYFAFSLILKLLPGAEKYWFSRRHVPKLIQSALDCQCIDSSVFNLQPLLTFTKKIICERANEMQNGELFKRLIEIGKNSNIGSQVEAADCLACIIQYHENLQPQFILDSIQIFLNVLPILQDDSLLRCLTIILKYFDKFNEQIFSLMIQHDVIDELEEILKEEESSEIILNLAQKLLENIHHQLENHT